MKKILVTGGAGYIGAHTCKLLSAKGYDPISIDNLSTGHADFVKWGELIIEDVKNTDLIEKIINKIKPIAVIHFAASAYVGESVINPKKYYYNNLLGSISLIEAMIRTNICNLIFSSTCATYGIPSKDFIHENTLQKPINPYGRSKLMIENILNDLATAKQINFYSLRYFNAAGADDDAEIGELHEPETHLIPLAIKSYLDNEYVLKIFGDNYETPDQSAIRDYIHVNDIANAHYLALEKILEFGNSNFINIGSGIGYSIFEIIQSLKKIGVNAKYVIDKRREGDPAILVADITKAKRILNWKPNYSLEDTLISAYKWHLNTKTRI